MMRRWLGCILLIAGALGQTAPDAASRFAQLQGSARDAREKRDKKGLLAIMLEMAQLLHYSGPSAERLALAYADLGDKKQTLQALRDFVVMGGSDDALIAAHQFDGLRSLPEFEELVKRMGLSRTPIQRAVAVAEMRDAKLIPEDIDYDPRTKRFLVTSVLGKKIVRIGLDGEQQDFAVAPDGWPMKGIKIDSRRGLVWATEAALDRFSAAPAKDWGKSAVICFRLEDGTVVRRIEGPAHSALGDMTTTPSGDVIVSDSTGGGVYRIPAKVADSDVMDRLDGGDFVSPHTPVLHPDGRRIFVPDYARGVGVLDPATKRVFWIETNRQHALQGIDGMYFKKGALIAIQNGNTPERVVRFHLDPSLTRVISEDIIERSTPTLGEPTHGVMVGDSFYYIANSGWDALDEEGKVKAGAKLTVARIMKASLNFRSSR